MQPNGFLVATALTAACLALMLVNRSDFKATKNYDIATHSDVASTADSVPIIIVNRSNQAIPMGCGGAGLGAEVSSDREDGERLYRTGDYRKAIQAFRRALEQGARDPRSLLGLGISYVAVGEFQNAIQPLCTLRNDCHRKRCTAEKQDEERHHDGAFIRDEESERWSYSDALDDLPKQARDTLDYEARQALEKAVISVARQQGFQKDSAGSEYKNERHYLVLKASLQLARHYHRAKSIEETAALFRLAQENTRNIPTELITELSAPGTREERWSALARLALNASTKEEKEWYSQELKEESSFFSSGDIRAVAACHFDNINHLENFPTELETPSETAETSENNTPKVFRFEPDGKHKFYSANADYNNGIAAYDSESLQRAKDCFKKALGKYEELDRKIEVANTRYNLGCLAYSDGDLRSAKEQFKLAALTYRSDANHAEDDRQASYNVAALCVESKSYPEDEAFLRAYDDKYHSIESSALYGLFLMKMNRPIDALKPLKNSAILSLDSKAQFPPPHFWEEEKAVAVPDDRSFTDDQVLERLFETFGRVDHYVNSRFAPTDPDSPYIVRRGTQLSHDSQRYYQGLSRQLYRQALVASGRTNELATFEKLLTKDAYPKPELVGTGQFSEKGYLNEIQQRIRTNWYCPVEESDEHTLVRLKVTTDGQITINSIERNAPLYNSLSTQEHETKLLESISGEALRWSSPLPPPPVTLANKEIIVIFDTHQAASEFSQQMVPVPLPGHNWFGPRSFRW
ncbi:tetratricopeptide repeat protein [Candidatus Obscuribacterales bacterium]|nr:tetratricopeptide repeat protein [Candidatus Obscuribacterales bacterium]